MKKILTFFVIISNLNYAYCSEVDDLFNLLESEVNKEKVKNRISKTRMINKNGKLPISNEISFWEKLKRSSKIELYIRNMFYLQEQSNSEDQDSKNFYIDGLLRLNSVMKYEKWLYGSEMWLNFGSQREMYRGVSNNIEDKESQGHIFEISKLYLIRSFENSDLTIGKSLYKTGAGGTYSPSNRFKQIDLNDPLNPKDLGSWLAQLDMYLSLNETLSFTILPVFNPTKIPDKSSRWSGTGDSSDGDIQTSDFSDTAEIQTVNPDTGIKNIIPVVQYKIIKNKMDIFFNIASTFSIGPVVKEKKVDILVNNSKRILEKKYVKVMTMGTGISTTYKNLELHGEALYQIAYGGKDDNYVDYIVGLTHNSNEIPQEIGIDKIESTIEYAGEIVTNNQSANSYIQSSKNSRKTPSNIIARILLNFNDHFKSGIATTYDFSDKGLLLGLGSEYTWDNASIGATIEIIDGESNGHYGQWKENDRVSLIFKLVY